MNKKEFIAQVANNVAKTDGISKKTVEAVIEEVIRVIKLNPNLTIQDFASLRLVFKKGRVYDVPSKGIVRTQDKMVPVLRPSPAWLRIIQWEFMS